MNTEQETVNIGDSVIAFRLRAGAQRRKLQRQATIDRARELQAELAQYGAGGFAPLPDDDGGLASYVGGLERELARYKTVRR